MKPTKLFLLIALVSITCCTTSKSVSTSEAQSKFLADSINGVYIPKDLVDCIEQINKILPDSTKEMAKTWTESTFSANTHFGLGMWIRNNWGLWQGSRLSHYFNNLGIMHPDDMSDIILVSYHRDLIQNSIKLDKQILDKTEYWKRAKENSIKQKKEDLAKYRIGDTVSFNYPYGYISNLQENNYFDDTCEAKGVVIAKNKRNYTVKVLLLETCEEQGVIIIYDNEDTMVHNPVSNQWEELEKRIILIARKNEAKWYDYNHWETVDE